MDKHRKTAEKIIPFVGFHAHSNFSIFDGLGNPDEHIQTAVDKGMNALALTDHGTMAGLPYQIIKTKKLWKKGIDFKPIFGEEFYFVPSLKSWNQQKKEHDLQKKKTSKKEDNATIIENEDRYSKNILNKRSHLILLAKNQKGLENLFSLVSKSYDEENFYRYPRVDYEMLAGCHEGIIANSACIGSNIFFDFWNTEEKYYPDVLKTIHNNASKMKEIFGKDFYGELQWNGLPIQHILNKALIQVCNDLKIEMISTGDSHYPRKEMWKDRELYRRLGWLGQKNADKKIVEPEYELFLKNGQETFEAYKRYSEISETEYDDGFILDTIARTQSISDEKIERFLPRNDIELPDFVVPFGKTDSRALLELAVDGIKAKGLNRNPVYRERLKKEIETIAERGFAKYFLTQRAICEMAKTSMLSGCGRGSSSGSLVSYLLGITQIDPIKYGLQFERFLGATEQCGIISDKGQEDYEGEVVEIETENGKTLQCTPNAQVWVERNGKRIWAKVGEIQEGDELLDKLPRF